MGGSLLLLHAVLISLVSVGTVGMLRIHPVLPHIVAVCIVVLFREAAEVLLELNCTRCVSKLKLGRLRVCGRHGRVGIRSGQTHRYQGSEHDKQTSHDAHTAHRPAVRKGEEEATGLGSPDLLPSP